MRPIHLIGVPLSLGGNCRGTDIGPAAFRIGGIREQLASLGLAVIDKGDIPSPSPEVNGAGDPHKRYVKDIARVCQKLCQTSLKSLDAGALPIVLGGDHSFGAGSVAATASWLKRHGRALGLIWVDAHGDMNTPEISESGNVHGMPLAALLGHEPLELAHFAGDGPAVLAEHTVVIGCRNLDEREKAAMHESKVHVFTMKDIDRLGMAHVMERAIAIAGRGTGGIHVSFDLDACDPEIAPGVGTPVKGGLDYREARMVMEMVADSGQLTSLDLAECNPMLDIRNTTAELGIELALSAMGRQLY